MSKFFLDKTVLVTGAAGFVGSHLVDALIAAGARVIGVDNFVTGRESNLRHLDKKQKSGKFIFIQTDAIQSPAIYLDDAIKLDVIFHLASPASPPRYQEHPVETYLVNSLGTHHLLDYLQTTNSNGRFVFASTSEVYGDPQIHPQTEDYWGHVNPNGVRSCYDEAKRFGESVCGVFNRDFKMDVRIARIFNTYGPRINPEDGRVIPNFVRQALANQALTVYGNGKQTRSYCYVSDLVAGLMKLASIDQAAGETINLGNPQEYTVMQTAQMVKSLTGATSGIIFEKLPADDPTRRQPNIDKAKKILNWAPQVGFKEGLSKTIESFKHEL